MPVQQKERSGAAVFELQRFEWAGPDRIEIVGSWSGVTGRRLIRPTLVLEVGGATTRLLAVLDHKPWQADEGEEWIAAFPWDGPPDKFDSAEMNVAPGIDLELPPPRLRRGRPLRKRIVSRDLSPAVEPLVRGPGIVTDPIPAAVPDAGADAPAAEAPAPKAPTAAPPPDDAAAPADAPVADAPTPVPDAPTPPGTGSTSGADTVPGPHPAPEAAASTPAAADTPDRSDPAAVDASGSAGEADAASAPEPSQPDPAIATLSAELERARDERASTLEDLKRLRQEREAERQAHQRALAEARAAGRAEANPVIEQGAELRAAVERQRELAYAARDRAESARDDAVAARKKAYAARDDALRAKRDAERERDAAFGERDRAYAQRDRAFAATPARPLRSPKPGSELDIWLPRAAAFVFLGVVALILLRLISGS